LLDRGVGANAQQDDLWGPLHLTVAARLLVLRGARIDILSDKEEKLHLIERRATGKAAVVRLLIDHGAKVNITDNDD
jgi:ankyrin repeat protein